MEKVHGDNRSSTVSNRTVNRESTPSITSGDSVSQVASETSKTLTRTTSEETISDVDTDGVEEEEEDDDETDFWNLLIRETVNSLVDEHHGEPIFKNVREVMDTKCMHAFINRMKEKFQIAEKIHEASLNDTLVGMIEKKSEKILEKFDDEEDIQGEAQDTAWKKYKYLVRKKVQNNLEELKPLAEEGSDGGDDDDDDDDDDDENMQE